MRRDSWFLVFLVCVLVVLVFARPEWGWNAQAFLRGSFLETNTLTKTRELQIENDILKADLALLKDIKKELPSANYSSRAALVYSRYPFGFKNELLVNVGKIHGIAVGAPVVLMLHDGVDSKAALIGTVAQVFEETSVVKTIFDESWRSAVLIGEKGTDALLVGGPDPKLTLIQKEATTTVGQIVYNASPGIPYGMAIGTIGSVGNTRDQLFHEATIKFSYELPAVRTVFVLTK